MDWLTGIQNAINYIEEHLTEDMDYEAVAAQAACSGFYFQRIFGILCGIPLGEYIRNRRLTLAGSELKASDKKVIDVALKYGYESPESFSRAFLRFHGITPSEAKREGAKLKSFSRIFVKITLSGGSVMNYRIVKKDAFDIVERVETHSALDGANIKSIPEFWTRAHMDGTVKTLLENTTDRAYIFGICYAGKAEDKDTFDYSIGAVCSREAVLSQGFRRNTIPARTWAVFECKGPMPEAIPALWKRIVSEFFPTSGYKPTYEMDIEAYSEGDMSAPDYHSEIWIPVIKA